MILLLSPLVGQHLTHVFIEWFRWGIPSPGQYKTGEIPGVVASLPPRVTWCARPVPHSTINIRRRPPIRPLASSRSTIDFLHLSSLVSLSPRANCPRNVTCKRGPYRHQQKGGRRLDLLIHLVIPSPRVCVCVKFKLLLDRVISGRGGYN